MAEALFHFAGLHELAERVRPSTRRPGRRVADEDAGTDAQGSEAQADSSGTPAAGESDAASQSADG